MSSITLKKIGSIFLVTCLVAFAAYYFLEEKKEPDRLAIAVTASKVQKQDVTMTAHAIGSVAPNISVSIKSRVDGQLLKIGFKEGDFVKENQILFQIDPRTYQVALQQAQASLARDQAQLDNYKNILSRYASLKNKGYVSKQDFDQADANVKAQSALVLADQATVSNADLNLEYTTIRAPIDGRTGAISLNSGSLVKATDSNPLVVINQINPITIHFSLPEQNRVFLQKEIEQKTVPVSIYIASQGKRVIGKLNFIDNTINTETGTIQLKALYDNQNQALWPGAYVKVSLPIAHIPQALVIPTRAIQAGPEGSFVFVVDSLSHARKKLITPGSAFHENTVVLSGLKEGESVITTGQIQLIDGTLVKVS